MSDRGQKYCILLLLFLHMIVNTLCVCSSNQVALVENLPDDRFSASIPSDSGHPPWEAKMSSGDAWCSVDITNINVSPYLQVNFTMPVEITSITIGGHDVFFSIFDDYINNYQVRYRPIGSAALQFVVDGDGNPLIIPREGNIDAQEYTLPNPIITEDILQIKVPPQSWSYDRACFTLEAHGCPADISPSESSSTTAIPSDSSTILSTQELASSPYIAPDMILSSLAITTVSYTHMISSSALPSLPSAPSITSLSPTNIIDSTTRDRRATSVSPQSTISTLRGYKRSFSTSISRQIITSSTTMRVASGSGTQRSSSSAVIAGASAGVIVVVVIILVIVGLLGVCVFVITRRSKRRRASTEVKLDNEMYGFPVGEDKGSSSIEKKKGMEHETAIGSNGHYNVEAGNVYEAVGSASSYHKYKNGGNQAYDKLHEEDTPVLDENGHVITTSKVGTYETVPHIFSTFANQDSYDYVTKTDISKDSQHQLQTNTSQRPPLPLPLSKGAGTSNSGLAGQRQDSRELLLPEGDSEPIVLTPNPLYGVGTLQREVEDTGLQPSLPGDDVNNPLYCSNEQGEIDTASGDIDNPLYSESSQLTTTDHPADNPVGGEGAECTTHDGTGDDADSTDHSSKIIDDDDDMQDNPLYGSK